MTRTITYAGKPLSDFNCFMDTSQVFKKPAKRVNNYTVPEHNGDYLISDRTFSNVQIVFNCFIRENYEQNYSDLVNYLNSFDTYQRLETSAEPTIYRMALLHASIEPDTGAFLQSGQFKITFDCLPQEFLKSGEAETEITGNNVTQTGNPVVIDNTSETVFVDRIRANLAPTQSTSGAKPWAIAGLTSATITNTVDDVADTYEIKFHTGKNMVNYPVWKTDGITGGTATWLNNGVRLTANSTDCYTNYEAASFPTSARIAVSQGDVLIMTWELTGTATGQAFIFGNGATSSMVSASATARYLTYTVPSGITFVTYRVGVRGNGSTLTYSNIMIRKNTTEGSFEEYGTTGLSTIYGGYIDFDSGELVVTMDVIEYYNGQTIGEPWLSSLDTYSAGATPTTGAKVVYTRGSRVTYDLDSQLIEMLAGENTLTTNADSITATATMPTTLANPTYMEAQPLFIIGSPGGSVYLNGERIIQVRSSSIYPLYIDTETMDAYGYINGARISQNTNVDLTHDLIKLKKGTNNLNKTGTAIMKIVPRWWRL